MKLKVNTNSHLLTVVILLTILLLVNIGFNASAQTTLLSEDFESGSTSWTITTNSGSTQNYWEVSNGTCSNGTSQLMIRRNNDNCNYRNNKATNTTASISVDSRGYEDLTLDFDWLCNGESGADFGQVFYSIDGSTWTALTDGGSAGIYQGTLTWSNESGIILPADVDDTTFYLGFVWQNNGSGGSGPAFGIDNIEVQGALISVAPPSTPSSGIFSEDFSTGSLPSGWSNTDATGTSAGTWSFNNPGSRTINTTTSANGFAIFDSENIGQDNKYEQAELETPAFDCSTYAIVTMEMEHYFKYSLPSHYQISISNDNGSTYNTLTLDSTETANAETWTADISTYAAGYSQVKLKFTYVGSYAQYWAIDDILVEGVLADSATWTGATNTDWNTASNWSNNSIPSTGTSILIPASAIQMPLVDTATGAAAHNLTIESGASLTIATDSLQGGNLTITGNLTCNGTISNTGNAHIRLSGANKYLSGNYTGGDDVLWMIESGASYLLNGDLTTFGVRIDHGADLDMNGHDISAYTFEQYGTIDLGSSTLSIAGDQFVLTDATLNEGTGTVYFNSGSSTWASKATVSQTVPGVTYYDLQVKANSGYTATLGDGNSFIVSNHLTITDTDSLGGNITTGSTLTVLGDITIGHAASSGIYFTVAHQIKGGGSNSSLIMPSSSSGNLFTISYTNTELAAISSFSGSSMQLNFPIYYSASGNQMIAPLDYENLSISGTGTKSLGGDITINGDLVLSTATLSTTISMVEEVVTTDNSSTIPYVSNGVANNNTTPALATLASNATSMTVTVPSNYASYLVNGLKLDIVHASNSDLDIYLASPGGTVYVVSTDNGGNGAGYVNTQFSDAGSGSMPNNSVLDGHYVPEGFTFSSLPTPISGTWTLYVVDDANGDDGTLMDFSLQLKENATHADLTVKGDWTNTSGTFVAGNGLVTFSGSSLQQITSNGNSFYQVLVNNSAGLSLMDDLTVDNTLTLSNGVVTTGSNMLVMTSTNAADLTAFGQNAFVNGNLRRYIASNTSTYDLPVGNGTSTSNYRLAQLTNNLLVGITFLDAYFQTLQNHNDAQMNVTDGGMSITSMNTAGTWVIEPNTQPTLGSYTVNLSLTGFIGLVDNEFVILKRPVGSTSGADWSTGGGLLNSANSVGRLISDGVAVRTGLTSFSEFGIGDGSGGGASLPIELLSFTAKANSTNEVQLDWSTAVEINNDHFVVERSIDGKNWETVAKVTGAGNSSIQQAYTSYDHEPAGGTNYYRLKQIDTDGSFTYSDIEMIDIAEQERVLGVELYPNPNKGRFTLNISGTDETELQIIVWDLRGQKVFSINHHLDGMNSRLDLDLENILETGNYLVQVTSGQNIDTQHVIIQ